MQTSLFNLENRYASLSGAGDPLERPGAVIDSEIFRPILARIDVKERKPLCRVRMFMLLLLQRLACLAVVGATLPIGAVQAPGGPFHLGDNIAKSPCI